MAGRIQRRPDHGAASPGPPTGWRPRALQIKEKLEIVVRQGGKEPGGARLAPLDGIDFDHQPPIQLREWDASAGDTIPPSCSLEHIVALNRSTHREKTATRDVPAIAKVDRITGATGNTRKQKIASRGFSKGKRPMRSRKFPKDMP